VGAGDALAVRGLTERPAAAAAGDDVAAARMTGVDVPDGVAGAVV
jgi:hypothetical protein